METLLSGYWKKVIEKAFHKGLSEECHRDKVSDPI